MFGGRWWLLRGVWLLCHQIPRVPQRLRFLHQQIGVLFALRLWAPAWSGKHVLIFCDNAATVSATNSCRAEDPLIRAVLREFWWLSAVWDVQLAIRHKPGKEMETADLLGRAYLSPNHHGRFEEFCRDSSECRLNVNSGFLSPPLHL